MKVPVRADHPLLLGYLGGNGGTLPGPARPLPGREQSIGVLGFARWRRYSAAARTPIYYLLVLIAGSAAVMTEQRRSLKRTS
jgi:hypothetical protein